MQRPVLHGLSETVQSDKGTRLRGPRWMFGRLGAFSCSGCACLISAIYFQPIDLDRMGDK